MVIVVLAEILELFKVAETQHLSQQQEQPINGPSLGVPKEWLHTIFSSTMLTSWQHWLHPNLGCPIMHPTLLLLNEFQQFTQFALHINLHLEPFIAPVALNPPLDRNNLALLEVFVAVHCGSPIRGPWKRWSDGFTLSPTRTGTRRT